MTNDPAPTPLTEADQAYYNQLDEDVTAGRIPTIGHGTHRDGSRISDADLDAILRGRPGLGQSHATGRGRSPRRQVRLPEHTNAALDAYIEKHGTTASAVIRLAAKHKIYVPIATEVYEILRGKDVEASLKDLLRKK